MKRIQKAGSPHAYSQWCTEVAGTQKSDWREVPSEQKRTVLGALIGEQGGLCAYTMRRIDETSSHVEHIKPQSRCRADHPGSDLDYANLVACFPRAGMKVEYRYGAQLKGGWWANGGVDFVSPLWPACESVFRFRLDGAIEPIGDRVDARNTIRLLGLNHKILTEDRERVMAEFIYGPTGDRPISGAKARNARKTVCDRATSGLFREFCVALRDALSEHLTALAKAGRRKRALLGRR